jgi:hypothetical protein
MSTPPAPSSSSATKVIRLLQRARLLDEDRTRLLLSWPHSGFSVHNSVTIPAGDYHALEALARYCGRNPVSLDRLRFTCVTRFGARNRSSYLDRPPLSVP